MLDFLMISTRSGKRGVIEIYPKFIIKKSNDLMIRGGDFYAIWIDERGIWSTDEQDAVDLIDRELDQYAEENRKRFDGTVRVLHMWDAETGMIDTWHKYCQKQMKDQFHMLDEKLIFSNTKAGKRDYASKSLPYPLESGETPAWDKLVSTLYSPEERHKIEWSIGAIVSGESKRIQKFLVFYGAVGTGKSTIINVIQQLFDGYYTSFNAKDLGSSSNAFALEAFRSNPLVAIQHDGDLSRIEDNTRINSLVSHEMMTVNEKFRSAYSNRFKAFLIMGTNKPVKITDGAVIEEPAAGRVGVEHGFQGGKRLGGNDEQRGFRVHFLEDGIQIMAIDIGDEMHVDAFDMERAQSLANHARSQIGTADADIDDVGDRFAGVTFPFACMHFLGKQTHLFQYRLDIRNDVFAIDHDRFAARCAQCRMQYGTMF